MAVTYGTSPDKSVFPRTISGLTLWLDANDTSTLFDSNTGGNTIITDGTAIGRWQDKSGNNRHAIQSTAGFRAVFKSSIQNRRNIVRFDGNDDFYTGIGAGLQTLSGSNKMTFFIACIPDLAGRNANFGGGGIIRKMNTGNCPDYYFGVRSGGNFALNLTCGTNGSKASTTALTTNTARIIGFSFDATPNPDTISLYLNENIESIVESDGSGGWGTGDGELGRGYDPGSSYYFKGDMCEIIAYNSVLSSVNIKKVVYYLKNKWRIN